MGYSIYILFLILYLILILILVRNIGVTLRNICVTSFVFVIFRLLVSVRKALAFPVVPHTDFRLFSDAIHTLHVLILFPIREHDEIVDYFDHAEALKRAEGKLNSRERSAERNGKHLV